jgi:hypothetical protein
MSKDKGGGGAVAKYFARKNMKKLRIFFDIIYGSGIYCKGTENETTGRKILRVENFYFRSVEVLNVANSQEFHSKVFLKHEYMKGKEKTLFQS